MNPSQAEAVASAPQTGRTAPRETIMGGLAPGESADCPPPVAPVEPGTPRPFWSVMIPAYNPDAAYLAQTLKGVLGAGIPAEEMQIEVLDDTSTKVDVAQLVHTIAGDRVKVYRQPANLGQRRNWNSCIDRARGEWVHLLHADDIVFPEFYARMREAIEAHVQAGAAFCRHAHIREDGKPFYISELERDTPGIVENFAQRMAVIQRIQPPSIVVRRTTYEHLGGFWVAPGSCVDWEMWVRVSAHSPVLYSPETLACYRLHSSSGTSYLRQTAAMTADAGKAIELFNAYFPQEQRVELMRLGKQHYAHSAYQSAKVLIQNKNYEAAIAHVDEALKLDPTPESAQLAEQIMALIPASALTGEGDFFGSDEVQNIEQIVASYHQNPADPETAGQLRALRQGLGDYLLKAETASLAELFQSNFGRVYRLLLKSGFQNEPLSENEAVLAEELTRDFGSAFDFRNLLAHLLYRLAHHRGIPLALETIPDWFLDDYLAYVLHSPQMFLQPGEADLYCAHLLEWVRAIHRRTRTAPGAALTLKVAQHFTRFANFIPLYFVKESTKELMVKRAGIIEYFLEKNGAALNAKFPPILSTRHKIKVGFLNAHFASQTETYSTLPTLSLDRDKFEICVFALSSRPNPLEDYCRTIADQFIALPSKLNEQVAAIRKAALDIVLIGTNVTAVTNQMTLLAAHRLAPVQLVSNSSPVTSGLKMMDGYISGSGCETDGAAAHYSEKLLLLDGPAHCFEYGIDAQPAQVQFTREQFGIPPDAIVFVSGANCFKILPELMETWASILKQVDGSRLLLHPFNPNWSSAYPVRQFERSMAECFARHGVDPSRLILSADRLPTRTDVKELLRLGDIYLDSYPFAGVNSTVDPLELNIPPIAWEGDTFRSLMAGSLLRDLQIPDLIVRDETAYIDLAVRLAKDSALRTRLRQEIESKMALRPRFLDCDTYGRGLGDLLETLVPKRKYRPSKKDPAAAPRPGADPLQTAIALHTGGQLAEAEEHYRQILLANPQNADAWHLIGVLAHQCGNDESAIEFIEQALQLTPQNAVFWNNLAEAYSGQGTIEKALQCSRRALELQPDLAEAMISLASHLLKSGETEEALNWFPKALAIKPDYAEGLLQYGITLTSLQRHKEALPLLKKACAIDPESVEARYHLGVVWEETGRYVEALACYEKASRLNPNVGEVWHRRGKLLIGLKEYTKAQPVLLEALRCNDRDPDYHYQYGNALQMSNRNQEALAHFDQALELGGDTAELHNNRGILLKVQGRGFDAAESFHRALKVKPEMTSALNNLGAVCADLGLTSEALECIQLLAAKRPDMPSLHNNLGKLLKDSGRAEEALASYWRSIELNPDAPEVHHNYLLCLNYVAGRDPVEIFEAHRAWGERTARKIRPAYQWRNWDLDPDRKLRIGYVSADLCHHPVAVFIESLFAHHNREQFEITAYSDAKRPDSVTERLKAQVEHWRDTAEMDPATLARQIWDDKIDILVDLSGHTAWNRLEMFALKPAPIQVSYLGYPATSGLATIDYRITDHHADPAGTTEHLHTEKLVRMPACAWCYQAPEDAPPVSLRPSAQTGHITFGCFNQFAKITPPQLELWARLLQRVPGSHLKLKARTLRDPAVVKNLIDFFGSRGIASTRLEISGFLPSIAGHLEEYQKVDIALDSYPYHGTTTTCEALWMGVPVVTQAGTSHVSRVGVSLLNAVGLPDLIAADAEQYLEIAASLAENEPRLAELRAGMRTRMLVSPLMDQPAFAADMDAAYRQMWKDHIAK